MVIGSAERMARLDQREGRPAAARRSARGERRRAGPPGAGARRWWCGSSTASTATRSPRPTPRCSRPITCWRRRAMPTSTWCSRDALVLIDPMQNPDGRARFVFQNLQGRAATPDPAPYNAEHDEPWPGGRSNHYLFDMNRDWFAQTQPETRGRHAGGARLLAAGQRRPARAGRRQRLLLRAAGRSAEPAHHEEPDRGLRSVRPRQRCSASTSAAGRTTSARSTTRSIRATASRGRSSRARSA